MSFADSLVLNRLKSKAFELGFVQIGITPAISTDSDNKNLKEWIDKGYDADMKWIERSFDKRTNVKKIMPEAETVISLAYNYFTPFTHQEIKPKISRYAWGHDYHKILKIKLKELCTFIETTLTEIKNLKAVSYTDDGPVTEKIWAERSGIGWMGKHTIIISPYFGSWIFLSEIITNLKFNSYDKPIENICGKCTICIDACPTGALSSEYVLDSNRCISYQTIENRGIIPEQLNLHGWIFGCDICQDVCPFNSNAVPSTDKNFSPFEEAFNKSLMELNAIDENDFKRIFIYSPVKRTKYSGWKRNLQFFEKEHLPG